MKSLAIWYGDPATAPAADVLVLGEGVEQYNHWAYKTAAVMASKRKVFGYVSVGDRRYAEDKRGPLSTARMLTAIEEWEQLGAEGVLLDEFGYDYWNDDGEMNVRQAAALGMCHSLGLTPVMNAWAPADCPWSATAPGDVYLFESWQKDMGESDRLKWWRDNHRAGTEAWAVTTAPVPGRLCVSGERRARSVAERFGISAFQYGVDDRYGT